MGTVIAMPLAGILAEYVSWESIFYVFGKLLNLIFGLEKEFPKCRLCFAGLIALAWCVVWWAVVEDSPDQDRSITDQVDFLL
jgi:hypothetical protein